jgi:fatty-acyl-CoA synthase
VHLSPCEGHIFSASIQPAEVIEQTVQTLLSYDHGASTEPLLGRTIGDHFTLVAADNCSEPALISCEQGQSYTYTELKERVDLLARGFLRLGIARGDRLGIWSTNNAEWVMTQLAAAEVGAVLVNINPAYRTHELEYALKQSGVKLLVVIPSFKSSDYLSMLNGLVHNLFCVDGDHKLSCLPQLEHIVVIGKDVELQGKLMSFERVIAMGAETPGAELTKRMSELQFDDPVNIQYTSGTTGLPKGVTLSHHNLLNNAVMAARVMDLDNASRFCVPMPFYHCGGMISSSLAALSVGGTVVIPGPYFNEDEVLNAVQDHHCTHVSGVPTMFIAQLDHPEFSSFDLSSLRGGFMAGAPCPVQLMRRVAGEMHMDEVVILYGLTEASPLMTATTANDSLEVRSTTVGRAIPGIEVKIVDPVTSFVVPRGVQGEICSRGHGVMLGYWNNPGATADAIDKAGWLHSGDLGVMQENGLINITGRKKDMIIRGGENIYPREIEEILLDHPAVNQAQIFGVPDEKLGEEVAAWILMKQGSHADAAQITEWLKERIAFFKVPRYIKIVSEFPMTVTGKIQKFVMREQMIKDLGLEGASQIQTA